MPSEPNRLPSGIHLDSRLSVLLNVAPDATLIVDRQGTILLANAQAEELFGHERGGLVGLGVEHLMPERFRAQHRGHRERFERAPRTRGMGSGLRLSGSRRDGSEFPIEVSLNPVPFEDGAPWVVVAVRDIADRLQREELAHQTELMVESNQIKAMFLANMSHELRTPLNAVIGFTELLHDELAGPLNFQQKDFLATVLSSAQHLHRLINGMLDLARIQAGRMEFQPTTFALRALMDEVRDSMRVLAARKQLTLCVEVDAALDAIAIDALRLKQVLINFVANAIKFTPEGGVISMRARSEGESMFRLEVEDTGPGIPADQLEKLFVEFQQLELGARYGRESTGLGLALSKRIVEAQGGRVGVSSTPGRGSVFYTVLPMRYVAS